MKAIKYLALVAFVALIGATMTSCGGYSNGSAKDMIQKYEDGKLENDDYAKMIDWYINYKDKYNDELESVIEDNKDNYQEYEFALTEMEAEFISNYPFMGKIEKIIGRASMEDKMGKENKEKFNDYAKKQADRIAALLKKAPKKK